ncbi:pentapeptide repeat-containing protein [Streptomyces sp. CA-252508]|uniref:pentapeptide repeat-containing protein n=1 Tax=Streptomyces sp. CA-252508 TaxID=3418946 RepID=UPI003D91845C
MANLQSFRKPRTSSGGEGPFDLNCGSPGRDSPGADVLKRVSISIRMPCSASLYRGLWAMPGPAQAGEPPGCVSIKVRTLRRLRARRSRKPLLLKPLLPGHHVSYLIKQCPGPALRRRGWCQGVGLSGANLTGQRISRANFTGTNLTKANLAGAKIAGAKFYRAKLAGARGIAQPS